MTFTEEMIGRRVREIATGDEGVVFSILDGNPSSAYIQWSSGKCTGETLHISFNKIVFIDSTVNTPDASDVHSEKFLKFLGYRLVLLNYNEYTISW